MSESELFIDAATLGNTATIMRMLDQGVDINYPGQRVHGRSALMQATLHGHADTVRLLLDRGVSIN